MQTTLKWTHAIGDVNKPMVQVDHREHCGDCKKHLTFRLGQNVIEIHTDDEGLKRLSAALLEHPIAMRKAMEDKISQAVAEAKRLGLEIDEAALV